MITIIDYGVGNINAFKSIYNSLGISVTIAKKAEHLNDASKLILPGVGHFDYAMAKFKDSGMIEIVNDLVLKNNVPILGICVGMQMLACSSEEGVIPGLGWIDATVKKIDTSLLMNYATRLPHMGWNDVSFRCNNSLFDGITEDPIFYFLHSYYFDCKSGSDVIATSNYGKEFACAVNFKNIYGVQFHPEKSHKSGIQLLANFSNL